MMYTRPGIKLAHRFRSRVIGMTTFDDRLIVALENGKCYRSNRKVTRWYKISPTSTRNHHD